MRKIISLGLLALMFSLFSGQLLAGKVQVCEEKKAELKPLGLYGLCNAYWNAGNDNARLKILTNFNEKAGPGGPGMPGLDTADCPCWDIDVLENIVACSGYTYILPWTDQTEDESGFDLVAFQDVNSIQVWAGFTPLFMPDSEDVEEDVEECYLFNAFAGKPPFVETSSDQDAACRLDILNLIAEPPTANDCVE